MVTYSALQTFLKKPIAKKEKTDTVIFIGNIKKHKGLSVLLEAFHEVCLTGLKYTLFVVGSKDNVRSQDQDMTHALQNSNNDSINFTGFIGETDLKNLLAAASLLVQPSLYEGFGLPPLEAMSLGTRALISDIPVFKEIYAGFPVTFFRAGDAVDLKKKMVTLLNDKTSLFPVLPDHLRNKYTFKKTASIILDELTG
jgi:glycosyltransferase involved in cell wall biosynthesis